MDGVPFASAQPDMKSRWKVSAPQGDLFPGPRTLARKATAGAVVEAAARLELTGDERSPLRADLVRLAQLGAALTRCIHLTESEGAQLMGGRDTPENRRRFNRSMWAARELAIEMRPGIRWALIDAEPGPINRVGPARWWADQDAEAPLAYRLSGGLFRTATMWGAVERTVAGLEGALTWGPAAGKGRQGGAHQQGKENSAKVHTRSRSVVGFPA